MRPAGIGRLRVRRITASMSRSYHMLIAPHAPAATAMHSTAVKPSTGCRWPGAINRPISPVNTTSAITRGLSSAIQSLSSAARGVTASLIGQRMRGSSA